MAELVKPQKDTKEGVQILYLNYGQAARALSLSVSGVKKLVRNGRLPVVHFGKSARIRVADLIEYGDSCKVRRSHVPDERRGR